MLNHLRLAICDMLCSAKVVCITTPAKKEPESTREDRIARRYEDMERRVDKLYWKPRDTFKI